MKKEAEEAIENVACEENLGRNCGLHEGESGIEASSSFEKALTEFRQNLE